MPRSQHILCNCTNSVKERMNVDDHQGLIKDLNKILHLDSVVLVSFPGNCVCLCLCVC